ncbi:MAG: c-type cytochrome [Nitrospirae bacterium]|nr:c-type cytochrome [Nitrospirota bacterium]
MTRIVKWAWVSFGVFLMGTASEGAAPAPSRQGEALYKEQCSICHGAEGKGDGSAAEFLFPKPRNFTTGTFKVRSTPSGSPPTDQDLLNTVTQGMPGSAMPGFSFLSKGDRLALVSHVKRLANLQEKPEGTIAVSSPPAATPETLAQGKKLYREMKCWECHGDEGRADGPSTGTLKDDSGEAILANDFTRGIYKGGGTLSDIVFRFATGMDGTPMPSYEDSLKEPERWALARYVKSLAGPKVAVQPTTGTVVVKRVSGPVPTDTMDPAWGKVPAVPVPLMLLWQRNEAAADEVSVKALHNGKEIALLLEWKDEEVSTRFRRDRHFADAAAVMFSLAPQVPLSRQAHFAMGEKKKPVNIWYWALDRRMDLVGVEPPVQPAFARGPALVAGWGSGNAASVPLRPSAIVEDLNAEGFGTLTAQPRADQNVNGSGFYAAGRWRVVFTRDLRSRGALDAPLEPGRAIPVAFAVWNGSAEDRDGQKAVSTWYRLVLAR